MPRKRTTKNNEEQQEGSMTVAARPDTLATNKNYVNNDNNSVNTFESNPELVDSTNAAA